MNRKEQLEYLVKACQRRNMPERAKSYEKELKKLEKEEQKKKIC